MDRDVTIRFYEIIKNEDFGSELDDVLREIDELAKTDRERDVPGGIVLRLEHVTRYGGLVYGDLTRVQTENLPGHVTDAENDPLPVDRIGHPAAFCFDPESGVMALQFDIKIGIGRVCAYFSQFADDQVFSHMPVLRQDALDKFVEETPTSFTAKVSRVRNFEHAETRLGDFEEGIERMADLFGGLSVEITVSCKASDGGLNKGEAVRTLRRMLALKDEIGGINKLRGSTLESDDAYNFIKFLLKEKETLDLPANDPIDGRDKRIRYIRRVYTQHRSYLRAATGVA